ncbi:MAG: Orotate phosphoribosyltransferase [Chlamydiales bacterium]|nr:Orotate phosphoribosyltransferase [Chlamydiales bacterium]
MIQDILLQLHQIGAIKFGEFQLKSGILSPIYVDLRLIISYPNLLKQISSMMWEKVKEIHFDCICGVPYTALPLATALSLEHTLPMLMRRKEAKAYGTKKIIEGVITPGQNCLLVEDLITSGMSIFETIDPLEKEGLKITDIVVLLDREQGGKQRIEQRGYTLHSVFTMETLLSTLKEQQKIETHTVDAVQNFLAANQC